jgi:hypothetical protein
VGIKFDLSLQKKHPGINASLASNNGGICSVAYDDFDENDPEMKPKQLACGH